MKNLVGGYLVLALALLGACGNSMPSNGDAATGGDARSDAPAAEGGGGMAGRCIVDTSTAPMTGCIVIPASVPEAEARTNCMSTMGSFAFGDCPTANRIGRCDYTTSSGIAQTVYFYAPMTLDQARTACASSNNGMFTPG